MKRRYLLSALASALLLATACGGGGGGGSTTVAGGGTGGTGTDNLNSPTTPVSVSVGAMTVGSIIVNGIRYDDSAASIRRDDNTVSRTSLDDGMVVRLRGTRGDDGVSGVASDVRVENEVRGAVQSVNAAASPPTFVVLGQTVSADNLAVFRNVAGVSALRAGDRVEVHGQRDLAGQIRATRVELQLTGAAADNVRGAVANLSAGTFTFTVGGLTVNFTNAAFQPTGTGAANLANGVVVEARGTFTAPNRLDAIAVTFEDQSTAATFTPSSSGKFSIEGYVSGFTTLANSFRVDDRIVRAATGVAFEQGPSIDFANNVRVEAEGSLNSVGELVATRLAFRGARTIVTGLASPPSSCTFTVLGQTVRVNDATEVRPAGGGSSTGCGNLAWITALTRLEVRGRLNVVGSGASAVREIVAERVDGNPSGGGADIMQALVTSESEPLATLLLQTQVTVNLQSAQLRDASDQAITRSAFYATVVPNRTVVKIKGTLAGNQFAATEAEIEN